MYLSDYHTHTRLSMDGQVPLSVMAERAAQAGMRELCVTDHFDLLDADANRVYDYDWPAAVRQFEETVPQFAGRLKLKLGLEFGMGHIDPPVSERVLAQPGLDFVIGSVHNLSPERGGADLFYLDYSTPEACHDALDDYFTSMEKLVATDYYDVLGHVIYPLRYMNGLADIHPYLDRVSEILRTVISKGRGMEVNTYRGRTVRDWVPVLERYRDLGGELVTTGSDAHDPAHAGAGIAEACALLRELGFRYVTVYEGRRPRQMAL